MSKVVDTTDLGRNNKNLTKELQIQKSTLPTASASEVDHIYQYVGTTGNGLVNGYYYKCVNNNGTYEWQAINVQDGISGELPIWRGTRAEHDAEVLAGTLPNNIIIGIVDEFDDAVIYGAEWNGTSTTSWSRTDKAVNFTAPDPAINNSGVNSSSPFDTIMPWAGMVKEERTGGTMVKIPKYWYKWTRSDGKMKLQISSVPISGFYVSPAHANRGDGKGERDYVYVGAYHCAENTYMSTTGTLPQFGKTRPEFRAAIHNLGENIWQYDYAMYWTIIMLYLVEYANWDSQSVIGRGCGDGSNVTNNGTCDVMQYHTGTDAVGRTTYGHTRYRYIEGLWDNALDCCDGIYFSGADIYCVKNPADFSETTGGTLVGTRPTSGGFISDWTSPSAPGFEYALFPSAVAGSNETYVCDKYSYTASVTSLFIGGGTGRKLDRGLFCMDSSTVITSSTDFISSRIMELP